MDINYYKEFIVEIHILCEEFRTCCKTVGGRGKRDEVNMKLGKICREGRRRMSVENPAVLVALMDAYEITRDEGMLQEVLDVVSGGIGRLSVSLESVKLLSYCYYYVEEEECANLAREMLQELLKGGEEIRTKEFAEVLDVYRELTRDAEFGK